MQVKETLLAIYAVKNTPLHLSQCIYTVSKNNLSVYIVVCKKKYFL